MGNISFFGSPPNNNKIITIKHTQGGKDWRTNLYTIVGEDNTLLGEGFSSLDVDKDVFLLMDNDTPTLKANLPLHEPINEFIKDNKSLSMILSGANIASQVFNNGASSPWIKNLPAYDINGEANTIEFSYTFKFSMGKFGLWNAQKEVVIPILNLISPIFIRELGYFAFTPPYPTGIQILINTIKDSFNKFFIEHSEEKASLNDSDSKGYLETPKAISGNTWDFVQKFFEGIAGTLYEQYQKYTYTVKFGNIMTFYDLMLTGYDGLKFSKEVDQYGYPISGEVTISFKGIIPQSLKVKNNTVNSAVRFGKIGD